MSPRTSQAALRQYVGAASERIARPTDHFVSPLARAGPYQTATERSPAAGNEGEAHAHWSAYDRRHAFDLGSRVRRTERVGEAMKYCKADVARLCPACKWAADESSPA
jgi:hypothetical protein